MRSAGQAGAQDLAHLAHAAGGRDPAERARAQAELAAEGAREMPRAGVAQLQGEARQVAAALGEALQGGPEAQPVAVLMDGLTRLPPEDAAEVEGRAVHLACKSLERQPLPETPRQDGLHGRRE